MADEILIFQIKNPATSGKAVDSGTPLSRGDRRLVQRAGEWIADNNLWPDVLLTGRGKWEKEVATSLAHAMHRPADLVREEAAVAKGGPKRMLSMLAEMRPVPRRLLIAGGRETALSWSLMLNGRSIKDKAVIRHLKLNRSVDRLRPGEARLLRDIQSSDLPNSFSYPGPGGREKRVRPAYFYTQSGVIPYRFGKKGPEFLLVRSSNDRHWMIPKGVREPGVSSLEAAETEAWEEAGVLGQTEKSSLGHVQYEKWGASCSCEVFAMEVKRLLPPSKWPESKRGREWFTAEQAQARVKHESLGRMIRDLAAGLVKAGRTGKR